MPYSGPNDSTLPEGVQSLPENDRERWVAIFNESYDRCMTDDGDADTCEGVAFRNANGVVRNIQHVAANVMGTTWTEVWDGREWLVAPVVLLKEQVLKGTEYAPAEEISKYVEAWNGRPFVLCHPTDEQGRYISANDPGFLERRGLGWVFNVRWDPDTGLVGQVWVDIAKAKALGSEPRKVYERLDKSEPLEVSTGYWRDVLERAGQYNGVAYNVTQTNIRPDHLAALPDDIGACSWEDGCGAPRVNQEVSMPEMVVNVRDTARTPTYSGTTTGAWSAPTLGDFGYESVDDMSADEKAEVAAYSLLGDAQADDFRNLLFFPVVTPSGDLSEAALRAVIGGRGAQADIPADALESARRKAYALLNDEFDAELEYAPVGEQSANDQEDTMAEATELRDNIREMGLTFTDEELEGFSEDQLSAIVAAAGHMPDPEPEPESNHDDDDEAPETPEPTGNRQDPPVSQEKPDEVEAFMANWKQMIDDLGGVDSIRETLAGIRQETEARRARIVNELSANDRCRLTETELQSMGLDTLLRLRESFQDADYSGLGMGPAINEGEGEYELPMPSLFED